MTWRIKQSHFRRRYPDTRLQIPCTSYLKDTNWEKPAIKRTLISSKNFSQTDSLRPQSYRFFKIPKRQPRLFPFSTRKGGQRQAWTWGIELRGLLTWDLNNRQDTMTAVFRHHCQGTQRIFHFYNTRKSRTAGQFPQKTWDSWGSSGLEEIWMPHPRWDWWNRIKKEGTPKRLRKRQP